MPCLWDNQPEAFVPPAVPAFAVLPLCVTFLCIYRLLYSLWAGHYSLQIVGNSQLQVYYSSALPRRDVVPVALYFSYAPLSFALPRVWREQPVPCLENLPLRAA